jgi:hypothetical protein
VNKLKESERELVSCFNVFYNGFVFFIIELIRQLRAGEDQVGTDQTVEK